MAGIRVDALPKTVLPSAQHVVAAMKDGLAVQLTVQQIIDQAKAAIIDGAPEALDTLNELASALGDDVNFASNVLASIAQKAETSQVQAGLDQKADLSGATFTGNILSPNQPCFSAHGSGTILVSIAQYTPPLANALSNVGGHYNTANSTFTVPVDGVYLMTLKWQPGGRGNGLLGSFLVNGAEVGQCYRTYGHLADGSATSGYHTTLSITVPIKLQQGDYVQPYVGAASGSSQVLDLNYTIFSGVLLG